MDVVILCNRARKAEETSEADLIKRQQVKEEEEELALQHKLYGKYSNRGTGGSKNKKRPSSGGGDESSTAYRGNFRYGKSFEKAKVGFFLQATRKVRSLSLSVTTQVVTLPYLVMTLTLSNPHLFVLWLTDGQPRRLAYVRHRYVSCVQQLQR